MRLKVQKLLTFKNKKRRNYIIIKIVKVKSSYIYIYTRNLLSIYILKRKYEYLTLLSFKYFCKGSSVVIVKNSAANEREYGSHNF